MGTHPIFESDFDCLTDEVAEKMTQVQAKSDSELNDLERWITQKRAELARDKADLGTSNKENEPLATLQTDAAIAAAPAAAGVAPEALLFKLGDDYQVRKARYNEELKTQFEQTQIEKDALQRATSRLRDQKTNPTKKPYFEVLGQDLFQKRPGTAQAKAAKMARYKRELEEQLAAQKNTKKPYGRRASQYQQPEFINDAGSKALPGAVQQQAPPPPQFMRALLSPTPPRISQEAPTPTVQSQSTPHISNYQLPPGYGGQPIIVNSKNSFELSSAIDRATMEMNINQSRLDSSMGNHHHHRPPVHLSQGFYPEPAGATRTQRQEFPEPRKVSIETPMVAKSSDNNDIFNTSGGFTSQRQQQRGNQKEDYARELAAQMAEKNQRKVAEKRKQDEYDRRLEREIATYDPFGKGGGGAPVRDVNGRLITDLRQMKVVNDTVQNNMDRVYELKDTKQADVTTPRPATHARIDEPDRYEPPQRITDYAEPRRKVDYSYGEYLLQEAARKRREKEEAAAREREEDARAEARFMKQQEQLKAEAEAEQAKKRDEQRAKQQSRQQPAPLPALALGGAAPKSGNAEHVTARRQRNVIQIDDWAEQDRQLQAKLRALKGNQAQTGGLPRTPLHTNRSGKTKTPTPSSHPPVHSSRSTTSQQQLQQRKAAIKNSSSSTQRSTQQQQQQRRQKTPSYNNKRQNSALSDISWDNRSTNHQYQPTPPTQQQHQNHQHHSNRVISQLDQLKRQVKNEYLRIAYHLNEQQIESPPNQQPRSQSAAKYPLPLELAPSPPPPRPRSNKPPHISHDDVIQTREDYVDEARLERELTGDELMLIENEDIAGVKNTVKLTEESEFVPAPGEVADESNSLVVHPESELDYELLERKNTERMKELSRLDDEHSSDEPKLIAHSNHHAS